jgi:hypothetical protein
MTPVPAPADLFGLETIRFIRGGHRGTDILIRGRQPPILGKRLRQQRRGLRSSGEHRSAGDAHGQSNGKFHKVTAFHDISLFVHGE